MFSFLLCFTLPCPLSVCLCPLSCVVLEVMFSSRSVPLYCVHSSMLFCSLGDVRGMTNVHLPMCAHVSRPLFMHVLATCCVVFPFLIVSSLQHCFVLMVRLFSFAFVFHCPTFSSYPRSSVFSSCDCFMSRPCPCPRQSMETRSDHNTHCFSSANAVLCSSSVSPLHVHAVSCCPLGRVLSLPCPCVQIIAGQTTTHISILPHRLLFLSRVLRSCPRCILLSLRSCPEPAVSVSPGRPGPD